MRSAPAAMTWELLQRGKWAFLGAYLGSLALPALLYTAIRFEGGFDPDDQAVVGVHMGMMLFGGLLFGSAIFATVGETWRLYAFPVTTPTLVAWRMIPAMAVMSLGYLATAATLNAVFHVGWPLWGPAMFMAVALAACGASGSLAEKSAWHMLVIFVPTMLAVGVWFYSRHELIFGPGVTQMWRELTAGEVLTMLAATAAAYCAAVVGVARSRRGEAPGTPRFFLWIGKLLDPAPAPAAAFRSPAQAQFWFEWRQKGLAMPAAVLMVGTMFLLGWLCFSRLAQDLFEGALFGGVFLPIVGLVIGLFMGNAGPTDAKLEMGHFLATRPMTSAEMSRTMLKTAAISVLIAWGIWVLAFLAVYVVLQAAHFPIRLDAPTPFGRWYFPAMLLGGWLSVALLATLGQAGRIRVSMVLFFSMMALLICGLLFSKYVLSRDPQLAAYVGKGSLIAAGIVFVLGTAWAFAAARRRSLVGSPTVYAAAGLWIAASALVASETWSAPAAPLAVYIFAGGVLALAALPLAGAPLALAWNRNR